jgi:enolase
VCDVVDEVTDEVGTKIAVGADMAASSLWNEKTQHYDYKREGVSRDIKEHYNFVLSLVDEFSLAYLEDPFHEEDFESFRALQSERPRMLVCGDDLVVTNPARLKKAIDANAVSAIIVKPNQIGTLTDTREVTAAAKRSGIVPVISHRSGETTGAEISHIAVGYGAPIIKCGIVGGERTAKINELIRIWERGGGERGPLQMARIKLGA